MEELSPHPRPARAPGDLDVESNVVCVMTRFELRRRRHLYEAYRSFRRVRRELTVARSPGHLHSIFAVTSPTTFLTISFWRDETAIPIFGTRVPEHVSAARRIFRRLRLDGDGRPALWSTKWNLFRVSNNLQWSELNELSLLSQDEYLGEEER